MEGETLRRRIEEETIVNVEGETPLNVVKSGRIAGFAQRVWKVYLLVFGIWIGLLGWKSQVVELEQSPFDTQVFFCFVSPFALCITLLVYWILFDATNGLKYSDMVRNILSGLLYFSGILAHLSLLVLYCFPPKLNWIGYSLVSGLFLVMLAYTFRDQLMTLGKKIAEIWVRMIKWLKEKKTSSRTTPASV